MSSSMDFPLFAELPSELRLRIWEESILDQHRDRLVPVNHSTRRVICISNLKCSGQFGATSESREVATGLFPIRLPVSRRITEDHGHDDEVDDNKNTDDTRYTPKGVVYISPILDIFICNMEDLAEVDHFETAVGRGVEYVQDKDFAWRSPSLSRAQCQSVRRLMVVNSVEPSSYLPGCRGTPYCLFMRNGVAYNSEWEEAKVFPGFQEYLTAVLEEDDVTEAHVYKLILEKTGSQVLEWLKEKNLLACFDPEQLKGFQDENDRSVCRCDGQQGSVIMS